MPYPQHIWGGGMATDYASSNETGDDPSITITNQDFESPALNGGATQNTNVPGWTFAGNAGIVNPQQPRLDAITAIGEIGKGMKYGSVTAAPRARPTK